MAFVVTSGQLQAVQQPAMYGAGAWTPRGVALTPALVLTYEQLWRAQPALRTVAGFLARNVAQLSVDPYRRVSATDREKAPDHPLAGILERPMPGTAWTKYRLLNTLMHDLCIFDNAYWLKMGDNGIRGVQPVPPRLMQPHGKSQFAPDFYRMTGNRGTQDFSPRDVVHFHGYNPDDPRVGVAPVETLRQVLAEEHAASVYREQMWRNGARVAGYILRPKDAPRWSTDAKDRFRADWQQQYAGDGPATGGTPVLEDGMEFKGSAVTPRDAQYVEARKLTREEVAVAYHVSPIMLGVMDGATYGNVNEFHKMLYQDTLAPWLVQIAQDLECQLLDDLDPVAAKDRSVYVEFNIEGKLAGSFEEQAAAMQSATGGPWLTRNEARAMRNKPSIEGADELIVPLNVVAGGLASPNDTAPDNPSNEASNGQLPKAADAAGVAGVLRRYFVRQGKAVASAVGAGHTTPETALEPRWDAELAADLGRGRDGIKAAAAAINADTRAHLAQALCTDDPTGAVTELYDGYVAARADDIARELMEATP